MRHSAPLAGGLNHITPASEVDAAPKPKPVGSAMWLILLLAGGLWLVIWALFATMSQ